MDMEDMEERILEAMEHTGLDLGEEDTKMDWREMLTNHRPSGSISSQPRFPRIVIGRITQPMRMKILDLVEREGVRNLAIL